MLTRLSIEDIAVVFSFCVKTLEKPYFTFNAGHQFSAVDRHQGYRLDSNTVDRRLLYCLMLNQQVCDFGLSECADIVIDRDVDTSDRDGIGSDHDGMGSDYDLSP